MEVWDAACRTLQHQLLGAINRLAVYVRRSCSDANALMVNTDTGDAISHFFKRPEKFFYGGRFNRPWSFRHTQSFRSAQAILAFAFLGATAYAEIL